MKSVTIQLIAEDFSQETYKAVIDWNILKKGKTYLLYIYYLSEGKREEVYYNLTHVKKILSYEKEN